MEIASSINGVPIRLTEERWNHIVNNGMTWPVTRRIASELLRNRT
jgi:hypothetical protein